MPRKFTLSRPSKRSFAEKFFPAMPERLLDKALSLAQKQIDTASPKIGLPRAINGAYIKWLKKESMLHNANRLALKYSGKARLWQNPYAKPRPRSAVKLASVWYTAYPISMITKPNESILGSLGNKALWDVFEIIGIRGLHTGPMKRAGGLNGWKATPSIDGHFDRISTRVDPTLGTEAEFCRMARIAAGHNSIIIDDIVPGHTGKGADFRLAEMNYGEYPGIYHMIEIHPDHWHYLPNVPRGKDSVNLNQATEEHLKQAGYIIGRLQRVIFYEKGVKDTNWSATKVVRGTDGIKRRWVYLHYFKEGQPSLNWLDPSFAGMKLVVGDALHSIGELGTTGLRLDANGFLGIEKSNDDAPAWSEGHPLSEAANQLIAGMVRKAGGFTFQELNLSIDDIKAMSTDGADLSYDFITRPAYHHALATGNTEFLRLCLKNAHAAGVDPASLVHALQNHDELTFELVHFWTVHKDDEYEYGGTVLKGSELRTIIRKDLRDAITGSTAAFNLPFTDNGIACTTASFIAAALGYSSIDKLKLEEVEHIKKAHLLLAMFNALQPGVFALSGWDLTGALTVDPEQTQVKRLIADGDTRWINRGAYDLMGDNPHARQSSCWMPKAKSLYGTLPEQISNQDSFASQLKRILEIRESCGLPTARQIDVPGVLNPGLLVMVHQLDTVGHFQVTALNFSEHPITETIKSDHLPQGASVTDMFTGRHKAAVDNLHSFVLNLAPHSGSSLLVVL